MVGIVIKNTDAGCLFSMPVPTEQFEQFFLNWKRGEGDAGVVSNLYSMTYGKWERLAELSQAIGKMF